MNGDVAETLRTALVELGDRVQNQALDGSLRGAVVIRLDWKGQIHCDFAGVNVAEVMGTLSVVQTQLMRKALGG